MNKNLGHLKDHLSWVWHCLSSSGFNNQDNYSRRLSTVLSDLYGAVNVINAALYL